MIRTFLVIFLAGAVNIGILAQSLHYGLPGIRNFSRSEYAGGIQSWSFCETENGLLYFANNSGLLEYNGEQWTLYNSVQAVNRSVCADGNRIYVGAYNEFGFYEANQKGALQYHSLTPLVKGKIGDFDEIWRIHKTSFGIVFQSFKAIFVYQKGKIEIIYPRSAFHLSYYVNGVLWVYGEDEGLMQYHEGKVSLVPGGGFFKGINIWSILPLNTNEVIIGTSRQGAFRYNGSKVLPWGSKINEQLKKYQLYSSVRLKNNYFAFGTIQNGIIVTDTAGNLVFEMNKDQGLQNNTVLGIGQDYKGNIWLCLDNGISMIGFDSPVSYFQNYFDIGTGYASARFGDNIYLGTNQGLFYIRWSDFINPAKSKSAIKLIDGTEGQVWNLSVIDNTLLCGHTNGVFQVRGNTAVKVSSVPGAWNFLKLPGKGTVLVGHYSGLSILENESGTWHFKRNIKGFKESSRFLQKDQSGNIWIGHSYKGIYRLKLDTALQKVAQMQLFNSKNGLPSDKSNFLYRLHTGIVVAAINGIYRFNDKTARFEKDVKCSSYYGNNQQVDYLYQDSSLNIWFHAGRQLGVLRIQEDGSYKKIITPFANLVNIVVPAFEHIYELDRNNILIGIEGGFANYMSKYNKDYSLPCTIYISDLRSDDTTQGVYRFNSKEVDQSVIPTFRFANNTISISYSANNFELPEVNFQYKLVGFDKNWSEWSTKKFKEYTNLPAGEYTFMLHAYNNDQVEPSALSYKFKILPAWYRSELAYAIYLIIFLLILYFGYKYLSKRIEKTHKTENLKQKEKYLNRVHVLKEEALISEKEMERLRNEKLNLEMIHKEKELANSTMLLIKKNNILNKLQGDLKNINSTMANDSVKNSLNSLIKRIDKEIDTEKQWTVFNMHIEQVYEDLFKKLKESYPELTPRELSLCAYLRMNISSKEIATLMNISARGVEISRYRIRKKLHLDREANLTEFMINL